MLRKTKEEIREEVNRVFMFLRDGCTANGFVYYKSLYYEFKARSDYNTIDKNGYLHQHELPEHEYVVGIELYLDGYVNNERLYKRSFYTMCGGFRFNTQDPHAEEKVSRFIEKALRKFGGKE